MTLHGQNFLGDQLSQGSRQTYRGVDPTTGRELEPPFFEATEQDVDRALNLAVGGFAEYRRREPSDRARFLRQIATEIDALGDALIERAASETALGVDRLRGERGRTTAQLKMFADLIEEGSWVDARIDRAQPERKPAPRPDVRRMKFPLGPVIVFGASNFPLAFSVAGGDTASAFAAGCPVVVKVHPAHPGTSEMVAGAIVRAIQVGGMPAGIFSMLHGRTPALSQALVRHPLATAVGFTGSLRAGRALFDAAAARPSPIPVYAEMGSINPVFLLPGALAQRGRQIAEGLRQSVTLGAGQFCTKPGVVVGLESPSTRDFVASATELLQAAAPATMLYPGIHQAFVDKVKQVSSVPGTSVAASTRAEGNQAGAMLLVAEGSTFLSRHELREEMFGPATTFVTASSREQMLQIARALDGHLTATIHGTPEDLREYQDLVEILQTKVGRLLFNGFPTGVEVVPAMHHGGPYPATTDPRSTSVGTAAIDRFVRPICYQNFPEGMLPPELRDANPRRIWRLIDGELTREPL